MVNLRLEASLTPNLGLQTSETDALSRRFGRVDASGQRLTVGWSYRVTTTVVPTVDQLYNASALGSAWRTQPLDR